MREGLCALVIILFAGYMLYGMAADIERLQEENKKIETRISELLREIEYKTHPGTIQRETLKWILREEAE